MIHFEDPSQDYQDDCPTCDGDGVVWCKSTLNAEVDKYIAVLEQQSRDEAAWNRVAFRAQGAKDFVDLGEISGTMYFEFRKPEENIGGSDD